MITVDKFRCVTVDFVPLSFSMFLHISPAGTNS